MLNIRKILDPNRGKTALYRYLVKQRDTFKFASDYVSRAEGIMQYREKPTETALRRAHEDREKAIAKFKYFLLEDILEIKTDGILPSDKEIAARVVKTIEKIDQRVTEGRTFGLSMNLTDYSEIYLMLTSIHEKFPESFPNLTDTEAHKGRKLALS